MAPTPASLLVRLRRPDDHAAWTRFVDLCTPLRFHWARPTGLQETDAADLVQHVFQALVRDLPEFTCDRFLDRFAVNRPGWGLALSPDGKLAYHATDDALLRSYDVETGQEVRRFEGHGNRVDDAAVSPDGRLVLTASADRTARLWGARIGKECLCIGGPRFQGVALRECTRQAGWPGVRDFVE